MNIIGEIHDGWIDEMCWFWPQVANRRKGEGTVFSGDNCRADCSRNFAEGREMPLSSIDGAFIHSADSRALQATPTAGIWIRHHFPEARLGGPAEACILVILSEGEPHRHHWICAWPGGLGSAVYQLRPMKCFPPFTLSRPALNLLWQRTEQLLSVRQLVLVMPWLFPWTGETHGAESRGLACCDSENPIYSDWEFCDYVIGYLVWLTLWTTTVPGLRDSIPWMPWVGHRRGFCAYIEEHDDPLFG